jgi:hypothetical protein
MVCVYGDWGRVRVHTLRQYLKQVTGIPPPEQLLTARFASNTVVAFDTLVATLALRSPPHQAMSRGRGRAAARDSSIATVAPMATAALLITDDTVMVTDAVKPLLGPYRQFLLDAAQRRGRCIDESLRLPLAVSSLVLAVVPAGG